MITFSSIIVSVFFLGCATPPSPDHVIAVTSIVSRQRSVRQAALIGVLWGLGHTITIFVVGSAIILFGLVIPPRVGLTMEFSVGLMLILLGLLNLAGIMRWVTETLTPAAHGGHAHALGHGDYIHSHPHHHEPEKHGHSEDATPLGWMDRTFGRIGVYQLVRPLAVGIVHGLAGSAAVALLVLTTIRIRLWLLPILLVFGLGTVAGMMLITAAIAVPLAYLRPALQALQSRPGIGFRRRQPGFRTVHRLSNGLRQRPFHRQSQLDTEIVRFELQLRKIARGRRPRGVGRMGCGVQRNL